VCPTYFKPFLRPLHLTGAQPGEVAAIIAENFDEAPGKSACPGNSLFTNREESS